MKFRFTRPALFDLAEIGRHTKQMWGEDQARCYWSAMTARLNWLLRNKSLWHHRSELGEGVYTYPEQSHVIVFREYEQGFEVLRILHQRMDAERHIRSGETE